MELMKVFNYNYGQGHLFVYHTPTIFNDHLLHHFANESQNVCGAFIRRVND